MKTPSNINLILLFAITFQIALIGLFRDEWRGEYSSVNAITGELRAHPLSVGDTLPPLPCSNTDHAGLYRPTAGVATTVFITGCECKAVVITSEADAAVKRHEAAVLLIPKPAEYISQYKAKYGVTEPTYSMRLVDEVSAFGTKEYPIAIHLSPKGTIVGIEKI
jgi:hypothetical protein